MKQRRPGAVGGERGRAAVRAGGCAMTKVVQFQRVP
jgi:hypothetical protein